MRSTHRHAFRPEEAPSGVSVGRITVAPLCWAHEDKTWREMFGRLARVWPGCQGEVLAPATPTCRGQEQCWVHMVVCDGHTYYTTMDRARDMYTQYQRSQHRTCNMLLADTVSIYIENILTAMKQLCDNAHL